MTGKKLSIFKQSVVAGVSRRYPDSVLNMENRVGASDAASGVHAPSIAMAVLSSQGDGS
jgi:hypothetical protein